MIILTSYNIYIYTITTIPPLAPPCAKRTSKACSTAASCSSGTCAEDTPQKGTPKTVGTLNQAKTMGKP